MTARRSVACSHCRVLSAPSVGRAAAVVVPLCTHFQARSWSRMVPVCTISPCISRLTSAWVWAWLLRVLLCSLGSPRTQTACQSARKGRPYQKCNWKKSLQPASCQLRWPKHIRCHRVKCKCAMPWMLRHQALQRNAELRRASTKLSSKILQTTAATFASQQKTSSAARGVCNDSCVHSTSTMWTHLKAKHPLHWQTLKGFHDPDDDIRISKISQGGCTIASCRSSRVLQADGESAQPARHHQRH